MSELSCESVNFSHLDHLESLESKKDDEILLEYRGITDLSNEAMNLLIKDYVMINETLASLTSRKGVSKDDILSIESLRSRYDVLDNFIKTHPIQMYTTESSEVMYEVSMENFIITAGKALWAVIKSIGKWIFNLIKNLFLNLTGQANNAAKINAKLGTQQPIIKYVNYVTSMASDVPAITKVVKGARDTSNQKLVKAFHMGHMAYYDDPLNHDNFITDVTNALLESYELLYIDMSTLVKEMTSITDPTKVPDLKSKYTKLLSEDRAIKLFTDSTKIAVSKLDDGSTKRTAVQQMWGSLPRESILHLTTLAHLPILEGSNVPVSFTPKMYADVFTNGTLPITKLPDDVISIIKDKLPRLLRSIGQLNAQFNTANAKTIDVEMALVTQKVGDLMTEYRSRVSYLNTVGARLEEVMNIRSHTANTMVDLIVVEAKTISKGVVANRKLLSVKNAVDHDRIQKDAVTAIKNARL